MGYMEYRRETSALCDSNCGQLTNKIRSILWWSFTVWGSRGSTLNVSQHPSKVDQICDLRKPDVTCQLKMVHIFECLGIGCRTIWAPWLYRLVKAQRSSNLGYFSWRPNTGLSCNPYSWEEWAKKGFYGCVGWMALHHEHVNQLFSSFTSLLLQDNQRKRRADKEINQGRKNPAADSGPWVTDLWIPLYNFAIVLTPGSQDNNILWRYVQPYHTFFDYW